MYSWVANAYPLVICALAVATRPLRRTSVDSGAQAAVAEGTLMSRRPAVVGVAVLVTVAGYAAPGAAGYERPGPTSLVSVSSSGQTANKGDGWSGPVVSADGRYVAFSSPASNLASNDTNG